MYYSYVYAARVNPVGCRIYILKEGIDIINALHFLALFDPFRYNEMMTKKRSVKDIVL